MRTKSENRLKRERGPSVDLADIMVLLGLALVGAGCGLIWIPLGLIVSGALLIVLGVVFAVIRARSQGGNDGDHNASD